MAYTHLTHIERYQIGLLDGLLDKKEIARRMNRSPSTIGRELKRNRGSEKYEPTQAHERSLARARARERPRRIAPETWVRVEELLVLDFSPEQVHGTLKGAGLPTVSTQRIYEHVQADKEAGGPLHGHLRHQKPRKRRYGSGKRRATIPNQVSIEKRPAIVDLRERCGDWEADLIIGGAQKQAIVTLVERQSGYTLMAHVPFKTADNVARAISSLLSPLKDRVHTLTTDNGTEFSLHEQIAKQLQADFFFAHPYASWERGSIENLNGLIRQYFPKTMRFNSITPEDIQFVTHRLNHRPRKRLGFKTPHEIFMKTIDSRKTPVALQG